MSKTLFVHSSSNSPESGIGMVSSNTSLPSSVDLPENNNQRSLAPTTSSEEGERREDEEEEYFDTEPLPILGRCRALYPFEGEQHNCYHKTWEFQLEPGDRRPRKSVELKLGHSS